MSLPWGAGEWYPPPPHFCNARHAEKDRDSIVGKNKMGTGKGGKSKLKRKRGGKKGGGGKR